MDAFSYSDGGLRVEGVPAEAIAEAVGTPVYVYSARTVREHYRKLDAAFSELPRIICFSIKSNSCLALLKILADEGAGFDVVSGGELFRAMRVGADPKKIVFAGVGKSDEEIEVALKAGILMFNVESEEELENINRIAGRIGTTAPVALRLNPDVDPHTHGYISTGKIENKFGLDLERAGALVAAAGRFGNVRITGVHVHIGSQITEVEPYAEALDRVGDFLRRNRSARAPMEYLDAGGGFGIFYRGGEAQPAEAFAHVMVPRIKPLGCTLILEPGRFIVGNAGVLLTRVRYVKTSPAKRFIIVDAGMNDLIRPSLYGAFHEVWPAKAGELPPSRGGPVAAAPGYGRADVVGPICESGDFLAKDRPMPEVKRGDLLCVFSAGAYGFTMSSNYNSRPRAPEVLVDGDRFRVVRRRETYEDLVALETF
ncbi:MAG: diaminopimelate decarboxylase [Planctomycetota bacterium]|nr:diaminopimelate decarboxylase [Planctomycetota bacterium]